MNNNTENMREQYDAYLTAHIENVSTALHWIIDRVPQILELAPSNLEDYTADSLCELIAQHDVSKYSDHEYWQYCDYFYGEKTELVKRGFDLAWLHHQHNNPHHWQHWLLREDDGDMKALEMPFNYVIEMICDWWSFSWNKGVLLEIFDWYKENKPKMLLHKNTEKLVEQILDILKNHIESNMESE